MTTVALLDTTALIAPPAIVVHNIRSFVSSTICRAELALGVTLAQKRESGEECRRRAVRLQAYDDVDIWLPFDRDAANKYGSLAAPLALKVVIASHGTGRPRPHQRKDALIAAHAASLGLPVLTSNTADFRKLGVQTITADQAATLINAAANA